MIEADELARAEATSVRYFAVTVPGLEALLAREVAQLGLTSRQVHGGVEGRASLPELWRLHRQSNLAESIRVRLKEFVARDFVTLEEQLSRLPWHAYVARGAAVDVRVVCHRSKLFHSDAVRERVHRVLQTKLGATHADVSHAGAQKVFLRLSRDEVTTSIDASGELLYRRGYRTRVGPAPLRETLACAMVTLLSDAAGATVRRVWDPFCGSGVLPLEWLRMTLQVPPGAQRRFAFEAWPSHPAEAYLKWQQQHVVPPPNQALQAWGSDIDAAAVGLAAGNASVFAQAFGLDVGAACQWQVGDFREVQARVPEATAIIANPPYGVRIGGGKGVAKIYADLEVLLRSRTDLRPVVLACGYRPFLAQAQLPWQRLVDTRVGGLNLSLLLLG